MKEKCFVEVRSPRTVEMKTHRLQRSTPEYTRTHTHTLTHSPLVVCSSHLRITTSRRLLTVSRRLLTVVVVD